MAIKVAFFHDDLAILNAYKVPLIRRGFEVTTFSTLREIEVIDKQERLKVDVAIIHSGLQLSHPGQRDQLVEPFYIMHQLLIKDARRILVSGHLFEQMSREAILKHADHYFCMPLDTTSGYWLQVIGLGKVNEDEEMLRGFWVRGEGGKEAHREIGIDPERRSYDDQVAKKRAKEGDQEW